MPRVSGVYNLPAGNPVVSGTTITTNWANTTLPDIATALTGSLPRDGSAAMLANLQLGGFVATGSGTAANPTELLSLGQANSTFAPLNSPALTGVPTAPTATAGTNTTQLATTAFVAAKAATLAPLANPVFTGQIFVPEGTASVPGLAFQNDGAPDTGLYHISDGVFGVTCNTTPVATFQSSGANLLGNPTAPTPAQFDNDTSIATTAFVNGLGIKSNGSTQYNVNTTLSAADVGRAIFCNTSANITLTLPSLAAIAGGGLIMVSNIGVGASTITLVRNPADTTAGFYTNGIQGQLSITLKVGQSIILFSQIDSWIQLAFNSPLYGDSTRTYSVAAGVAATDAVNVGQAFGVGQTLQNLTASRAVSTTYTNSTGKTITALITISEAAGTASGAFINGIQVGHFFAQSNGTFCTYTLPVPNGATYSVTGSSLESWIEIR